MSETSQIVFLNKLAVFTEAAKNPSKYCNNGLESNYYYIPFTVEGI